MQRESITKTAVFYHVSTAEPAGILGVLGTFPSKRAPEKGCNAAEERSAAEEKERKNLMSQSGIAMHGFFFF